MRVVEVLPILLVSILVSSGVQAGPAVLFTDGRSMRVDGVERAEGIATLFLEGGGVLALPEERIANWNEISESLERVTAPELPAVSIEELRATWGDPGSPWRLAAGPYADLIGRASERHAVDPVLLTAMAQVESAFDPLAVSPQGACGLLQLMPDTADRFGVADVFDAAQNVDGGARYLNWLLERYDGRTDLALAGYNAGEGAVDRHSGIPPYRETRHYVRQVLAGVDRLAALAP